MHKYDDLKAMLQAGLPAPPPEPPYFYPGPEDPDIPAGRVVVLTRQGGVGLQLEGLTDSIGWQVKAIGLQNDYNSAENLALDLDKIILDKYTQTIGTTRLISVQRAGDPPVPLLVDDAERTHFVCSYLFEVQSYVAPI